MSQETVEEERKLALEKQLLEVLAKFTAEERARIFGLIGERFCIHCGDEHTVKHPYCTCQDDS